MVQSMKAGAIGWIGEDDVDEVGAGPQAEGVEVFRAEVCVLLSGFVAAGGARPSEVWASRSCSCRYSSTTAPLVESALEAAEVTSW